MVEFQDVNFNVCFFVFRGRCPHLVHGSKNMLEYNKLLQTIINNCIPHNTKKNKVVKL